MALPTLTDEQKAQIARWAEEGAHLNRIQDRLKNELGITLTFMDTRFLISDLGIELRGEDPESETQAQPPAQRMLDEADADEWQDQAMDADLANSEVSSGTPPGGSAKVTVDEIAVPNALISGKVTFSDGKTASWYLDQLGRLGLGGVDRAYKPPEADLIAFQRELQTALRRAGL